MLELRTEKVVDCQEWDRLVVETYGRPYCLQQQEGCQSRGVRALSVPSKSNDEEMHESIPEKINGEDMGVKFATWLSRDPKAPVGDRSDEFGIGLFWERNFYPDSQEVANDLLRRGLIEAGEYLIIIDW
jgi:hypothetical protein